MLGQVDAHSLGGDLVVADGLERAAVSRIDNQHDDADADAGNDERENHAVKVGKLPQQVGGVGEGTHLLPLDDGAHDLGKAQRGNGQIVRLQL